ncbi:MAG TPA: hypothetical protein VND98_06650, partial [Solirubrobacterales bacterium]|nr:hypothetical protein [Solirubrobacterales bacterium]
KLYDVGVDGGLRWSAGPFQQEEFSSPAITADVVVVGIDDDLQVRSLQCEGESKRPWVARKKLPPPFPRT